MLAVRPELIWQQLHNRVQWAGNVATDMLDRERRRQPPTRAWFWMQAGRRDTALASLTAAADLCAESRHRQEIEHVIQALSAG